MIDEVFSVIVSISGFLSFKVKKERSLYHRSWCVSISQGASIFEHAQPSIQMERKNRLKLLKPSQSDMCMKQDRTNLTVAPYLAVRANLGESDSAPRSFAFQGYRGNRASSTNPDSTSQVDDKCAHAKFWDAPTEKPWGAAALRCELKNEMS